jgi:hypothetical protein
MVSQPAACSNRWIRVIEFVRIIERRFRRVHGSDVDDGVEYSISDPKVEGHIVTWMIDWDWREKQRN